MDPILKIKSIFEKYTTSYHFYLRDLVNDKEYELGTKKKYPICSCFKLAVLMAYFDSLKNESELFEEIVIPPEKFSPGGGVINYFTTPVKFTYFQLAQMMMSFSDGTATDILIEKVGLDVVTAKIQFLTQESGLSLNLSTMVESYQSYILQCKGSMFEKNIEAGKRIAVSDYSNAYDLAKLANASYLFSKSEFYQDILRAKKYSARSDLYFSDRIKFIGKTGSIGFGCFVNDCGVIELDGKPIALLGYATEGWEIAKELVELKCAYVSILACKTVGLNEFSPRLNPISESLIE